VVLVASPPYPGTVLEEQFLRPHGLSAGALARRLGVPRTRIERVVKGETSMTADTAVRLAAFFGNDPQFWMGLQSACDLYAARLRVELRSIRPLDAT
jgi:addiction module HigA family antidote